MVLPPAQVGQAYPPVGNQADAHRSPELIVDRHLGLMLLSGYIVERDALDPREEDLQVGEARVIGHGVTSYVRLAEHGKKLLLRVAQEPRSLSWRDRYWSR